LVNRRLDELDAAASPSVSNLFSARTRRRLARSPSLRDDVLARLLVERLSSLGSMIEAEAIDVLDNRAPGRGAVVVDYSIRAA
jgi:hypothetical protein